MMLTNNLKVKVFYIIFILILSLQTWTRADDISNFEIDGISVGDSLLDYLSIKQIKKKIIDYYVDDEFVAVEIDSKLENFDGIQVHYKENSNYIIHSVDGVFMIKNLNECMTKIEKIKNEFKKIFVNADKGDWDREPMFSKMGYLHGSYYYLNSGDFAEVSCYEYTDSDYANNGRVSIYTKEFDKWLSTARYK
jgi:hypothetical protein